MNFQTFIETSNYSPVYAAQQILYAPGSRPAKMAAALGLNVDAERTRLVLIASGKKSLEDTEGLVVKPKNKQDNAEEQAA